MIEDNHFVNKTCERKWKSQCLLCEDMYKEAESWWYKNQSLSLSMKILLHTSALHSLLFQLLIVYLWTFIHSWMDFHKICIFNIAKVFLWIQKLSHCILFHIIYYFIRCECFCFILLRISLMYVVHIKLCCCNLTFRTLHFEK